MAERNALSDLGLAMGEAAQTRFGSSGIQESFSRFPPWREIL
jgi:hypothetical protein